MKGKEEEEEEVVEEEEEEEDHLLLQTSDRHTYKLPICLSVTPTATATATDKVPHRRCIIMEIKNHPKLLHGVFTACCPMIYSLHLYSWTWDQYNNKKLQWLIPTDLFTV